MESLNKGQANLQYAILGLVIVSIIISGGAIYMVSSVPSKGDLKGLATKSDIEALSDRVSSLEGQGGGGPTGLEYPDTITIGVHAGLSGKGELFGTRNAVKGMRWLAAYINGQGGINGKIQINLVIKDDTFEAEKAASLTRELITKDDALAVIGAWGSDLGLAAEPVANELKTPYVGGGMTSKALREEEDWSFFTNPIEGYYSAVSKLYQEEGITKNSGLFALDTVEMHDLADAMKGILDWQDKEFVSEQTKDFVSNLQKLEDAGVKHLFFLPDTFSRSLSVYKQAIANDIQFKALGGTWSVVGTPVKDKIGKKAEGLFGTAAFVPGVYFHDKEDAYKDFMKYYQNSVGKKPTYHAVYGLSTLSVYVEAIEYLMDQNKELTKKNLRDAIVDMPKFHNFALSFDFAPDGTNKAFVERIVQYQVVDGSMDKYVVFPPKAAERDFLYPKPEW